MNVATIVEKMNNQRKWVMYFCCNACEFYSQRSNWEDILLFIFNMIFVIQ